MKLIPILLFCVFILSNIKLSGQCSGTSTINQTIEQTVNDTIWQSNTYELQTIYSTSSTYQWHVDGVAEIGATDFIYNFSSYGNTSHEYYCIINMNNGCIVSTPVFNQGLTSINDKDQSVFVYPTLASEYIIVKSLNNLLINKIKIINALGLEVYNELYLDKISLNTFSKGIYYIVIYDKNGVIISKTRFTKI
jgi:hypothetical protein